MMNKGWILKIIYMYFVLSLEVWQKTKINMTPVSLTPERKYPLFLPVQFIMCVFVLASNYTDLVNEKTQKICN